MYHYTLIGVDPGLVHTGAVALTLDHENRILTVGHRVINGASLDGVYDAVADLSVGGSGPITVTIEKYRDRGTTFSNNSKMRDFENDLKRTITGAKLLDNTGVKKVVTNDMMKLFQVWKFPTTNHRDLQAAARIGLYAGIKDEVLNPQLAKFVRENRSGQPWQINHL